MTKDKLLPLLLNNRALNKAQEKALEKVYKEIASMKNDARDADDWFILGYLELKEEHADEALDMFDRSIELSPDFEAAYRFRASAYAMLKDYKQAEKDATKAIELDSEYADAYYERAFIYKSLYEWDKALADCDKVMELEEDHLHGMLLKAKIQYDATKYDDAITSYTLVLDEESKNADALSSRGLAYFFNNQYEEALADIKKAKVIEGASLVFEFNIGIICCAIPERSKEAFRHLEKAFKKDGNLLLNYISYADKKESLRLIGKLNELSADVKKRKDENFYTRELYELLERKLKDANEALKA